MPNRVRFATLLVTIAHRERPRGCQRQRRCDAACSANDELCSEVRVRLFRPLRLGEQPFARCCSSQYRRFDSTTLDDRCAHLTTLQPSYGFSGTA